jgi:acetylornithine deacetylase/succinyl-diaminopimelate desuccinylase-like protein
VLALIAGCALLVAAAAADAKERSAQERRLREIYEQLIEIDTTHSTGSTTRAAEAMAERLRAAGIPEADVRVLGPERKGNLVARVRARGTPREKPLLLLAHLDVVEAKREDWSLDPFELTEKDGWFYGRGAIDDKAMAAIFVELAIELAESRAPLARDVIVALTADEEGGSENGVELLLRQHRALVDAGLVINEGGHSALRGGAPLYTALQAAEKTYLAFALRASDPGGHSSRPTPTNPILRVAAALGRVEKLVFPVTLNEVTHAYFERLARVERGPLAEAMAALARDPANAEAAARLSESPVYNATLRTTCTATQISGGHAPNALPQQAHAVVNCRALPGHAPADVQAALEAAVAGTGVELVAEVESASSPPARVDAAFLAEVTRVSESLWPGVPVVPIMGTGATDSTHFRLAGIPAYGVSGIYDELDDYRAHGRDERVGVEAFYDGLEFLRRLVGALATKT